MKEYVREWKSEVRVRSVGNVLWLRERECIHPRTVEVMCGLIRCLQIGGPPRPGVGRALEEAVTTRHDMAPALTKLPQ